MNEWALLHRGRIVNVVTTDKTKSEVQDSHPSYTVVALDGLPQAALELWWQRP